MMQKCSEIRCLEVNLRMKGLMQDSSKLQLIGSMPSIFINLKHTAFPVLSIFLGTTGFSQIAISP